jgi:hypothetical protein
VRHVTDEERRARVGRRHHLATEARATGPEPIARDLVGLHGSDPATVFLAAAARSKRPANAVAALERALYDDRTLVRTLGMRRTMFVVPVDLVPVVQAACTDALVPGQRKRLVRLIEENGIARDGARFLRGAERKTLAAIEAMGEATAGQLSKAVPELREQLRMGEGKKWAANVGLSTRVLFLLSTEQRVVRGRPNGSWSSSQYRWSPMDAWLPGGTPSMPAPDARTTLTDHWLRAFGPATTADLKWWTGWTVAQTRAALAGAGAIEATLDDGTGWLAAGDDAPVRAPKPWVAFLPALDPTTMGWYERGWYLGAHRSQLFDRNGNAGPTIWADGHVVGGWAQRKNGEVAYDVLDDVGRETTRTIERAAADLEAWFGNVRVTPRFPTPLQVRLTR